MTIKIPTEYSPKFSEFFWKFDNSLDELNVQSYGVSISTLEEVFLKIGHLENSSETKLDKDTTRKV